MSRTGVVVVTFGSPHLLDDHLGQVAWPAGTLVVVVDNFSTAANRAEVATRCAARGWEFVPMPDNRGFGAASNRGAAVALERGCDIVLLLNPDASCTPEVFAALTAECEADPLTMASPALQESDGTAATSWHTLDLRRGRHVRRADFDGTGLGDWLSTACVAIGAPLWRAIDGFDEGYFLYWEDVDLCRRVHEAGGRLVPRADLVARHEGGATQDKAVSSKSTLYLYMNCRNRLRYAAVHQSRAVQLRWLLHTPRESYRIAARAGRRALLRNPSLQWATVKGTFAGIGMILRGVR